MPVGSVLPKQFLFFPQPLEETQLVGEKNDDERQFGVKMSTAMTVFSSEF